MDRYKCTVSPKVLIYSFTAVFTWAPFERFFSIGVGSPMERGV